MVEIVGIYALLETRNALTLKERDHNRDPIVKVSRYVRKTVLIGRSILMIKKGNKEGRSVMPVI